MKHAALALLVVLLAACSAPATDALSTDERLYLGTVHDRTDLESLYSDDELIDLGHTVCATLQAGATVSDLLDSYAETTIDLDLSAMAGAAVGHFCPTYGP